MLRLTSREELLYQGDCEELHARLGGEDDLLHTSALFPFSFHWFVFCRSFRIHLGISRHSTNRKVGINSLFKNILLIYIYFLISLITKLTAENASYCQWKVATQQTLKASALAEICKPRIFSISREYNAVAVRVLTFMSLCLYNNILLHLHSM